jgi:HEAT repeat protein
VGSTLLLIAGWVHESAAQERGSGAKTATEWVKLLNDKDEDTVLIAATALMEMGEKAVPALIDTLKNAKGEARINAVHVLRLMGEKSKAAVPTLMDVLQDKDDDIRAQALWALSAIGPEARAAVPMLIAALSDKSRDVRYYAGSALGGVGPDAKAAVPALLIALKDKEWLVRGRAAYALGRIKYDGKVVVPALVAALEDKEIQSSAAWALGDFGPSAVPALVVALGHTDDDVRGWSAVALGHIGVEAREAVPALIEVVKSRNCTKSRSSAAVALGCIKSEVAIPVLIDAVKDNDADLRRVAAFALREFGAKAKPAVPTLIHALSDSDMYVRQHAGWALQEIDPEAAKKAGVPDRKESIRVFPPEPSK